MTHHKYSVIMMTYNQQDFVQDALSAILAQDCPHLEILVSDDKSDDATFARVTALVEAYRGPHKVLLNRNKKNMGITAHLNACFRMCTGELIIAASGDDISVQGRARKIIETYERDRPLLIHSRVDSATLNDGRPDPRFERIGLLQNPRIEDVARSMSLYIGATAAWARDIVDLFGDLPDRDCYEDLIFGFRAALEGRISFIDEQLVQYRVGQGASTLRQQDFSRADWTEARRKELRRSLVVLKERLRNARTFGLTQGDTVIAALESAIALAQARLNLHEAGADRRPLTGRLNYLTYAHAAISEMLNYRNALRRGM